VRPWLVPVFVLPLLATEPACLNCSERVLTSTGYIEVAKDATCPSADEVTGLSYGGDELISVDGEGTKKILEPVHQTCCYDGSFVIEGEPVSGTRCRYVPYEVSVPEGGDVSLCPTVSPGTTGDFWWYPVGSGSGISAAKVEVVSITGGPTIGSVTAPTWQCEYPVTVRKTSDVCG